MQNTSMSWHYSFYSGTNDFQLLLLSRFRYPTVDRYQLPAVTQFLHADPFAHSAGSDRCSGYLGVDTWFEGQCTVTSRIGSDVTVPNVLWVYVGNEEWSLSLLLPYQTLSLSSKLTLGLTRRIFDLMYSCFAYLPPPSDHMMRCCFSYLWDGVVSW